VSNLPYTILLNDRFTGLIAGISGTEFCVVNYGWEKDNLVINMMSSTTIDFTPDKNTGISASGSLSAIVYVNGVGYQVDLQKPDYPTISQVNSTCQVGTRTISNVPSGTPVKLDLTVSIGEFGNVNKPSSAWVNKPWGGTWSYPLKR
jgi:hypothetical protein